MKWLRWTRRKPFLMLLEGIEMGGDKYHHYMMNVYVGKDIMSYL
jgi:hypothetical protein